MDAEAAEGETAANTGAVICRCSSTPKEVTLMPMREVKREGLTADV